jgi:hypothetical protein
MSNGSGVQDVANGAYWKRRVAADERPWLYTSVQCARCAVVVQVAKFSLQHTSVQWTGQAVLGCEEFAARVAAGGNSALVPTCASLRESIEDAVAGGRLRVGFGEGGSGGGKSPP